MLLKYHISCSTKQTEEQHRQTNDPPHLCRAGPAARHCPACSGTGSQGWACPPTPHSRQMPGEGAQGEIICHCMDKKTVTGYWKMFNKNIVKACYFSFEII